MSSDQTAAELFRRYRAASDLRALLACVREFDVQTDARLQSRPVIRLALAGNYSTQFLAKGLPLALAARGVQVQLFEGGYNAWQPDFLDPNSELNAFKPTHVLLALTSIELLYGSLRTPVRIAQAIVDAVVALLSRSQARVLVTLPEPLQDERSDQSAAYAWRRETRMISGMPD